MSREFCADNLPNASKFSQQTNTINKIENTNGKSEGSLHISRRQISKKASSNPPFYTLINELRRRFPVNKRTQVQVQENVPQICHETGETLPKLDLDRSISSLGKQKGVSFSPKTLALDALMENSAEDLEDSITDGVLDINELDSNGETLLHRAAMEGDVDCIRVLINHGANVNIKNKEGWPPVHSALRHANIPAMVYLIECGADMNEYTQLRVAEFRKTEEISKQVYVEEEVFV